MTMLELRRAHYADAGLPVKDADDFPGFETKCPACDGISYVVVKGERDVKVWCEYNCDHDAVNYWLRRRAEPVIDDPSENGTDHAPVLPDEGVMTLRALFGALAVDVEAATLDPLDPMPGAPFLVPAASAQLSGPEGSGKSQVAQTIAYDVALTDKYALYLAGEVTHNEFITRARRISEPRHGKLTDAAVRAWRERVAFADIGDALPAIWRHPAAWRVVCADFSFVVLDAVSDAGAALNLKFARDNDDWLTFFQTFVKPCHGRVALLMLDNIGHGEDARTRAIGASAKGHKVDIRLSSRSRQEPLSLIIPAEKVRITNAPFRKGHRWVAYEAGCNPAVPFDASQMERERGERDGPDPVAVVVRALQENAPQGQMKLVDALRAAGIEGKNEALRAALKAMADDPDCPVRDTGGRGFELAPQTEELDLCPDPMPVPHARAPYRGGGTGGPEGTATADTFGGDGHDEDCERRDLA